MCMINEPVDSIADTKLFASFNNNKTKQLMIYSNKIENKIPLNAMVLPVPNCASVQFHSMKDIPNFFDNLDKKFIKQYLSNSLSRGITNSYGLSNSFDAKTLEVFDVGSYLVSKVETINDFDRLDKNVFQLSTGIKDIVSSKYSKHFGYLVCKLKIGNLNYEPLAYSHKSLIKNNKPYLFLPSYHYHPHESFNNHLSNASWFMETNTPHSNDNTYADDWSHDVYIVNFNPKAEFNQYLQQLDDFNTWKYVNNNKNVGYHKLNFDFPHNLTNYQKLHIEGNNINTDIVVEAY
jgi:hypothetical protein